MGHVVFCWELGQGFGHVMPYRRLVAALLDAGHRVTFVAREVATAARVLEGLEATLEQAPVCIERPAPVPAVSYAALLLNVGCADVPGLTARAGCWRRLFERLAPDALVLDHSPTALLAARGLAVPRVVAGAGFLQPPDANPLPPLRYWAPPPREALERAEGAALDALNAAARALGLPALGRVAELFDVEARWLTTFRELDHYPQRAGGEYLGRFAEAGFGWPPRWPPGRGPRVFAYLQPAPQSAPLLEALARRSWPTLVFAPRLAVDAGALPASIRVAREPLDMQAVGAEAALVACHGNHATVAASLLAARPLLLLPFTQEKAMVARRVHELGAGAVVPAREPGGVARALERVALGASFQDAARAFAGRYRDAGPGTATGRMLASLEALGLARP